jgi:nitrate/nitrite-specific signal transduction histidine kinase
LEQELAHRAQVRQILEQRVAERTRELTTLLDMSQQMASVLELRPLLTIILNQLQTLVDYTEATISVTPGRDLYHSRLPGQLSARTDCGLETNPAKRPRLFPDN